MRNGKTEAPSYEVQFGEDFKLLEEAWNAGVKRLIAMTELHMKTKPNIKINVGFTYQVIKSEIDLNGSFGEMEVRQVGKPKPGACKTRQIELYNIESVKPSILNLKDNIEKNCSFILR